jgi:hypothetical protein
MSERWDADALADIEAIKQLKARYCRLIDLKEWNMLSHLLADDVHIDFGDGRRFAGRDAFITFIRDRFSGATTVHQAHLPEIVLSGRNDATGLWAMDDHVEVTDGKGRRVHSQGYAYNEETYRKADDVWRISRIVVLPIPFVTLPTTELGI